MTMNTTTLSTIDLGTPDVSHVSFDHLYRALIQCFAIILAGYMAGRFGFITSTQSAGIGTFVSKFCLPALLFKSMCELNFSEVNWMFLVGVLIAKTSVFILVGLVTLLVKRPLNLGYTGLFAIFATQSNDFALGYPIVQALYGSTHPDYVKYLYLIAPISLVLLNPIGFILMEIHKHNSVQDESTEDGGVKKAVLHVLKGIVMNPIVFMTAIGVVGNFVFSGTVPGVLNDILTVLGNAYNASALFYLGLSMVGKIRNQLGLGMIVPVLLIAAKTIILPLITWEVVGWVGTGNETTSFSMYGFLYGTFPTAPSVFLYASDYGLGQDIVATGLVLGTFLSAPLMFVSAKMMTLIVVNGTDYKNILISTSFDISIVSITCCAWVIGCFLLSGKGKRFPHRFTMAFMFSHILASIGMIAFYYQGEDTSWHHYPIIICLLVGVFSTRCWTAVIAVALCLLHTRSLCFVLRKQIWFYFAGFGIPVFLTGILFLVGSHDISGEVDPSFHYGQLQTCFSLTILTISVIVTITSLVWWQRLERQGFGPAGENAYLRQDSIASARAARPSIVDYFRQDSTASNFPSRSSVSDFFRRGDSVTSSLPARSSEVDLMRHDGVAGSQVPVHRPNLRRQDSVTSTRGRMPSITEYNKSNGVGGARNIAITESDGNHVQEMESSYSDTKAPIQKSSPKNYSSCTDGQTLKKAASIEDLIPYPNTNAGACYEPDFETNAADIMETVSERTCLLSQCSTEQRHACMDRLRSYTANVLINGDMPQEDEELKSTREMTKAEYQTGHHLILLLLLLLSMFIGMFLCAWRVFHNKPTGIYVEIEFLDCVFNYGQGLLVLIVFGFDTRLVFSPLVRRIRRLIYGAEVLRLPRMSDLSDRTKQTCQQFTEYHKENCAREIVGNRRFRFRTFRDVFSGASLCDWLVRAGLADDRESAVSYGRHLVLGRVITHISGEHTFHDAAYFYKFLDTFEYMAC